ncbi:hypothetical protein [Aliivibrio finisterrensis]|uniref:Lipoprotein n=1 Tax=Aliivibrio finisterrensis TaxID=511998 RepID=A0A6N6RQ65_9GAMM|nr:hypothetical protein [Aliivibrio finisterrensis]KAB2823588.1 hypothetical protein F8B77_15015 [Aliivibrio finisterrensis]
MTRSKLTVCMFLVAALLTGCNESNKSNNSNSDTHFLKAIDGYLVDAEVYIDRNGNGIPEDDEKLKQLTNESGVIGIPVKDRDFDIIVEAIVGKTRDSDKGGTIDQSFRLVANGSGSVITPFTTIAKAQNKTLQELATELGYDVEVLSQDYIALKASNPEAKKVHLFARSVVGELNKDLGSDIFDKQIKTIKDEIDTLVNKDEDLDSLNIYLSDTGLASTVPMQPTLNEFLDNTKYTSMSFNDFWRTRDGELANWQFDIKKNTVSIEGNLFELMFDKFNPNSFFMTFPDNGEGCEVAYTAGICRSEMQDDFIFIDNKFALATSIDGDLQMYLKPSSTELITNQLLGVDSFPLTGMNIKENSYHHLDDKSNNWNSNPVLSEISKGSITLSNIENGLITMNDKEYVILRGNGQVYIMKRVSDNHPSLLFRSKELADFILDKWKNHTLEQPQ